MNRRRFLSLGAAAVVGAAASRDRSTAAQPPSASSFRGTRAGEERLVDGVAFCWCPPGRFLMGSPETEKNRRPDEGPVDVTLTRGFWAGKFEATQGQWRRLSGGFPDQPPSAALGEGADFPLYWVNFDEAEWFCEELTRRGRRDGSLPAAWRASLPTEAQWEYACRAGTTTAYAFGDTLDSAHARHDAEALGRPTRSSQGAARVGSFPPNAWGIHDMHGNVWEWCRDYYHRQLPGGTDPDLSARPGQQNRDGTYSRVRRGGAWVESVAYNRSATRLRYEPPRRSDHIGFRVFLTESHGDVEGMVSAQRPPAGTPVPADTTLRRTAR